MSSVHSVSLPQLAMVLTTLLVSVSSPRPLWAQATLENPQAGSFQSGIGVISGWVCSATRVDVEIDGTLFQAAYGTSREDTRSVCGDANNGFGLLFNWNLLRDGLHTVRALQDSVAFASVSVRVTTFGAEFLRDASGEFTLPGFPQPDRNITVRWQEGLQNFVIRGGSGSSGGNSGSGLQLLENPQPGSFQSGIGVISGWACAAGRIDIQLGGALFQAGYGTSREDTRSVCGDANNGFGLLFNWNLLGDGTHTVRALKDGVEFASVAVTVTTFGVEFLRDTSGRFALPGDFPSAGTTVTVRWQESLQNFVIEAVAGAGRASFLYGVSSGEVTSSSAVLWTHVNQAAEVTVEVATGLAFQTLSLTRTVVAAAENDFTAKVTVSPLDPERTYFYRWRQGSAVSEIATFKTAPVPAAPATLRFAFSGDSDGSQVNGLPFYNNFEALDAARREGLDFFVYLGDTVYADFRGGGRPVAQTLDDFRGLYKENREIAALRNLLRFTPTYAIWDDHEVQNDWDGQAVALPLFNSGRKAFFEYLPLTEANLPNDSACAGAPLFRVFHWGRDVDVIILDERSCRSADVAAACSAVPGSPDLAPALPASFRTVSGLPPAPPPGCLEALANPSRTLLGSVQKQRFKDALLTSTARFKFVINQVAIQQLLVLPYDRWEGYGAERREILNFIRSNNIRNVIFLTTDLHSNLINQVFIDNFTDSAPIADEFVTGPVATITLQEATLAMGGAAVLNSLNTVLDLVGVDCRQLDTFSYGVVDVNASAGTATITLKSDTGAVLVDQRNPAIRCVKTIGP